MPLTSNEHVYNGEIRDPDGRLITVGAGGAGLSDTDTHTSLQRRFGGPTIAKTPQATGAVRVQAAGDNTIYTPTSGNRPRLLWLGLSSSQNNAQEVLAIVKLGASTIYRWNMGNPGAFSHWQTVEGSANDLLVVNLSAGANPVDVNYTVEEF